jgi:membrane associated rhomboid family serine protease
MVLPIGDAPNPRGTPVVTWLLIAINVAVYLVITLPLGAERPSPHDPLLQPWLDATSHALHGRVPAHALLSQVSAYDLFVFRWGFRPAAPAAADLFTSMFLHAGLLHLAGNMLFLWIYGDNVEYRLGPLGFLVAYLATGVAAVLFHAAGAPGSQLPMIGASGAISGVLAFYFIWFPRNRVRLLWLLPPFLMQVVEWPARVVLGIYLVLDNLLPYLVASGEAGVAHGAHIGGFLAGLAGAWVLDRRGVAGRPAAFDDVPAAAPPSGSLRDHLAAAIGAGRLAEAASAYFAVPVGATRRLLAPGDSIALARWLLAEGHYDAAAVVARRHLRDYPAGPELADAHALAGEALLALGQSTPAWQHLQSALDLDPPPALAARVHRALATIDALQRRQRPA